jgi:hypothetical protein
MPTDRDRDIVGTMLQSLADEVRKTSNTVSSLGQELKGLTSAVQTLSEIVHEGNGHSLVTKVAVLEKQYEDISIIIDNKITEAAKGKSDSDHRDIIDNKQIKFLRAQVWAAIIPACLSLIVAILTLIYS